MTPGMFLLYVSAYFGLYTSVLFLLSFFQNATRLSSPVPRRFPSVTIAVPAFNEQRTIAATLKSLLELDYPVEKLRIIVIDDGSTDSTLALAEKFALHAPNLTLIAQKKNAGKAASLNHALADCRTELFGALDADSFVDHASLKKMVGFFDDSQIMAVTPSLKIYKPATFWQRIQSVEYLIGVYLRKVFSYFGSIHVTPGPFTIFRTSFFRQHGPYDEHNLTEDIEVALRIQSKQYRIQNTIDATVWTVGPRTFRALIHQRRRWYVGFINNVLHYRHLFSRTHGNLGLFILPGAFVSIALAILLFGYVGFKMLDHLVTFFQNLYAINFDILPWLRFHFDPFFITLDSLTALAFIALASGIFVVWLAKKHSGDPHSISSKYVLYLLVYWIVFAVWWCIAFQAKAFKKRIVWGAHEKQG